MLSLNIHASPTNPKQFQCKGAVPNGTNWELTGEQTVSQDGKVQYSFSIKYAARFSTQNFCGELDENQTTLSGSWGFDDKPFTFVFKRLSSDVMRFYPSPKELAKTKAPALWRFAISAILAQVRLKMQPWMWLQGRWKTGQRYAELSINLETRSLKPKETRALAMCLRSMTPEEARLYKTFTDMRRRSIPIYLYVPPPSSSDALMMYAGN